MKLGKRQIRIIILFGLATTTFYYMNKLLSVGGNFSEGFLVGFFAGLTFLFTIGILYTWLEMLYLNFKVRIKKEDLK